MQLVVENLLKVSPSSRRAWIEICSLAVFGAALVVALLAEGVDRNNRKQIVQYKDLDVALLAEGVDRNTLTPKTIYSKKSSPSSRRAWIEIENSTYGQKTKKGRPPRGGRG